MSLVPLSLLLVLFALAHSESVSPLFASRLKALSLLPNISVAQKFTLVHGTLSPYAGSTQLIRELGIPALYLEDGPQVL